MSKQSKDKVLKVLFSINENFASIFNNSIFKGKEIINPNSLVDNNTESIFKDDGEYKNRNRDLLKTATYKSDGKMGYLLLGIENQTTIDINMPLRIMQYDANNYLNQTNIENGRKNGKIKVYPVITLVIYYGKKKWTGPTDLYSRLDIDDSIKEYVSNYKINVISPLSLSDEEIDKYTKDLKQVFKVIKYSDNKDKLDKIINEDEDFKEVSIPVVDTINVFTNTSIEYKEEEGVINMCKAIEEMKQEAKNEKEYEVIKTMSNNGFDISTIAKALSLDINYVKLVLSK